MPHSHLHTALDRTGAIASIGCAIHCLVAPLIMLLAPVLGGIWVHPATHLAIAALVLPVAAIALRRGHRVHGRRWISIAGALGMTLVAIGTMLPFLPHAPHAAHHTGEACTHCCPTVSVDPDTGSYIWNVPPATILTMLGGAALVAAHLGNLRCGGACTAA